jgi:hypothetical protein
MAYNTGNNKYSKTWKKEMDWQWGSEQTLRSEPWHCKVIKIIIMSYAYFKWRWTLLFNSVCWPVI